jgi:hypothetical protein
MLKSMEMDVPARGSDWYKIERVDISDDSEFIADSRSFLSEL